MFEVVAHEKALYGLLDQMKTYWKTILDSYCFFLLRFLISGVVKSSQTHLKVSINMKHMCVFFTDICLNLKDTYYFLNSEVSCSYLVTPGLKNDRWNIIFWHKSGP